MACPGGCVGGGGQPIHDGVEMADERSKMLYKLDIERELHQSHHNQDVIDLYAQFLGEPLSEISEELLHTEHVHEKNYML